MLKVQVIAAPTASSPISCGEGITFVICPSSNNWNDFGFRLMVKVLIINSSGQQLVLDSDVKAYVDGEQDTSAFLRGLSGAQITSNGRINDRRFILSLGSRKNYQNLLQHLGSEHILPALQMSRDAAALYLRHEKDSDYRELSESSAFHEGILRSSEAYFAYIGLHRVLSESNESSMAWRLPIAIKFVEGVSPDGSVMEIDFADDILGANRIHAFIGPNGIGKTRLLGEMASSLCGNLPTGGRVDARAYLNEIVAANKRRTVVLTHEPKRWELARQSGANVESISISEDSWNGLSGELFDLARVSGSDDSDFSWMALMRIVRDEIPMRGLRFYRNDGSSFPWHIAARSFDLAAVRTTQEFDRSRAVEFYNEEEVQLALSSGQRAILVFLVRLFRSATQHCVVIIDEPETHLHPQFIALIMQALANSLEATESVAMIATHSPYVIQQIPRSGVTVLRQAQQGTEFAQPTFQTRGGDLSSISSFVFERSEADQPLLRERIMDFLSRQGPLTELELLNQLGGVLGEEGFDLARQLLKERSNA